MNSEQLGKSVNRVQDTAEAKEVIYKPLRGARMRMTPRHMAKGLGTDGKDGNKEIEKYINQKQNSKYNNV